MLRPWNNLAHVYLALTAGLSVVLSAGVLFHGFLGYVQSLPPVPLVVRVAPPAKVHPQILGVTATTSLPVDALIRGSFPTVYYAAADGFRYVFPNEKTFGSWFTDYGQVVAVSDEVLAQIPLKGNVTYRPGVRLIKIQTVPKVYAVAPGGTLRWVSDVATAAALYGPDWAQKVDDVPDVFFANYQEGAPITAAIDYQPSAALTQSPTINRDRGLPVTAAAPVATTAVGSSTIPTPRPVLPLAREQPGTSTPPLLGAPLPTTPTATSTATATPEMACPLGQKYDTEHQACLPTHAKDPRCGTNGYRDRYGGCIELPRGRFPVAAWAICRDKNCDMERGENALNCLIDCPGIFPPGYSTSTPTTTPSGTTPATPAQPAVPATPASPAQPASGSTGTTPATPAQPATPATPATPPSTSTTTATSTPPTADTTAPVISNIQASTITTATITWITNEPATSQVSYGLTSAYGGTTSLDATLVTTHTVTLSSLTSGATYHYKVIATDAAGNRAESGDQTLTVPSVPSGGAVLKWQFTAGSWFNGDPAIAADGTIYVGNSGSSGKLYAVNPDGTQRWAFFVGNDVKTPTIGPDGTIYFGSWDKNLYAVNPNGTKKWSVALDGYLNSSPAVAADGTIYIASGTTFNAINPDGTKKWSITAGAGRNSSPAIAADGTIYITYSQSLYAYHPNGTKKWEFAIGYTSSSPAIDADGTVYVGGGGGGAGIPTLYAVNPNGTQKWSFAWPTTYSPDSSVPVISADGTIYVSNRGGILVALNANGTEQWRKVYWGGTGERCNAGIPTVGADSTIYVGYTGDAPDNGLCAIAPDGTVRWILTTPDRDQYGAAIAPDGTLYFIGGATLYALTTESLGLANSPWPTLHKNNRRTGNALDPVTP